MSTLRSGGELAATTGRRGRPLGSKLRTCSQVRQNCGEQIRSHGQLIPVATVKPPLEASVRLPPHSNDRLDSVRPPSWAPKVSHSRCRTPAWSSWSRRGPDAVTGGRAVPFSGAARPCPKALMRGHNAWPLRCSPRARRCWGQHFSLAAGRQAGTCYLPARTASLLPLGLKGSRSYRPRCGPI